MDTTKRSPLDRLLFATFLKGRTSSRDIWEEKGDMTLEDNQKIIEETNEIINDDSTYPFISYLSDLLAKSKPSDDAVKKLHDCIDKVAVRWGTTAPMCSVRSLQNWSSNRKKSRPLTVCWRWQKSLPQDTNKTP